MNAEPISAGGAQVAPHPAGATAPRKRLHRYGVVGRSTAEAAGSFLLAFAAAAGLFSSTGGVTAPLAIGLAVAAGMVAFGYVSGGHFNPAISLGSAAAGRTPWKLLPVYVVAQLIGALLAFLILWVMFQGHPELTDTRQIFAVLANGYGADYQLGFPLAGALLAEVVAAALLVAVFLGSSTGRIPAASAAFAVGVTYVVLLTILAPITGGSLNPARSTAAAVFAGSTALGQLWLFWVAPVLGALVAGLIYRSIDLTIASASAAGDAEDFDADEDLDADEDAAAPAPAPKNVSQEKDADARGFFDGDTNGDTSGEDNGGDNGGRPAQA